jgi:hypothetical protein
MEFGRVFVRLSDLHRRPSRLKEHIPCLDGAIVDVLVIETGIQRHEQVPVLALTSQRGHAAIPFAVVGQHLVLHGLVVHNHRADAGPLQHDVRLLCTQGTRRSHHEGHGQNHSAPHFTAPCVSSVWLSVSCFGPFSSEAAQPGVGTRPRTFAIGPTCRGRGPGADRRDSSARSGRS